MTDAHNAESDAPKEVAPQDLKRALHNLEVLLYTIPSDGTPIGLRYFNGRIQFRDERINPDWHPLQLDYGTPQLIDGSGEA